MVDLEVSVGPAGRTPGPWHVAQGPTGIGRVVRAGEKPVAEMWLNGDDHDANARLISAAPELMDALLDTVAVLTAETVGTANMDSPDWYMSLDRAVEKACAALAKATLPSTDGEVR